MSYATNFLLIVLGINLVLFAFGEPEQNSPIIAVLKGIFTGGNFNLTAIITTMGSNVWLYGSLILIVVGASLATGAVPFISGGGGHGATMALQILAIAIFSSMLLVPNFAAFGFPSMLNCVDGVCDPPVLEIINMIFGALYIIAMIGLLRGIE